MGRIIAIDYGTKRTGLAITDPGQRIATPMETVPTHRLMNYLQESVVIIWPVAIVGGFPMQMDYSESESVKQIRYFVGAFRKRFKEVPVKWMDERFTSSLAMDTLVRGGMKKSRRREKGQVDRVSAALILQSYLEQRNKTPG